MGLIGDPERFERKLREAQAVALETMQPKQKEFDHCIALLEATEKEAEQIALATTQIKKGIVSEKLQAQADEVDRRYHALQVRRAKLEEGLKQELTDSNINDFLRFRETVAVGLDNPTFEDRRRWLEILQTTVTITGGVAVVTCRLRGEPLKYRLTEYNTIQDWVVN
jgi:hypothetical protein